MLAIITVSFFLLDFNLYTEIIFGTKVNIIFLILSLCSVVIHTKSKQTAEETSRIKLVKYVHV